MRFLLIASALGLLLCSAVVAAASPAAEPAPLAPLRRDPPAMLETLSKARAEIKGQNIYDCIQTITTDPIGDYRVMGTPSQAQFIQKYQNFIAAQSPRLKSQVVHFTEGGPGIGVNLPTGGNNMITVLPGKDLHKWVVMGGHYDTREETAGGAAIDNTSGMCTVREIARAVTALNLEPEATMVFAWWDGEEWGLFGSLAFVKDHSETAKLLGLPADAPIEILAGQSFDIVGINYPAYNTCPCYGDPATILETAVLNLRVPPTADDKFTLCPSYGCYTKLKDRDDFDSTILPNFLNYTALVKEINYRYFGLPAQWVQALDDQYGRSDQVPFIAAGIPGMRIQGSHDNEWPHYHHATDTLPAAISMAGGIDKLLAGFDQEAESGGLVEIYIALTGGLGNYAVPDDLLPADLGGLVQETPQVPALGAVGLFAAAGIALVALAARRE